MMREMVKMGVVVVAAAADPLPAVPLQVLSDAAPSPPSYCPLQPRLRPSIATFRCVLFNLVIWLGFSEKVHCLYRSL